MENYYIAYADAIHMLAYKSYSSYSIQELINKINKKEFEERTVPIYVTFGNIRIELEIEVYHESEYESDYEIGYYINIKTEEGWKGYDYSFTPVMINDNIEETMYYELMRFAREDELEWSKIHYSDKTNRICSYSSYDWRY